MEMVTVKIRGTVISARYGTMLSGDLLRTDALYARHLVEECGAAEYLNPRPGDAEAVPLPPPPKPRKKG